jgi:hypothetical protein
LRRLVALTRVGALSDWMSCVVEDRNSGRARGGEQFSGRLDGGKGMFAARAGMDPVQFGDRLRPALIGQLVKIDGEQRRRRTDEGLADVVAVDVEHVRGNDVLPAMVLEFVGHRVLLRSHDAASNHRGQA